MIKKKVNELVVFGLLHWRRGVAAGGLAPGSGGVGEHLAAGDQGVVEVLGEELGVAQVPRRRVAVVEPAHRAPAPAAAATAVSVRRRRRRRRLEVAVHPPYQRLVLIDELFNGIPAI